MRLRIQVRHEAVRRAHVAVPARHELVQGRVLDREAAVAHATVHVHDRVAGRAGQAGMRFGRVDLVLDRTLEASVEEHGVIVAPRAPLARLGPDDLLHVLDRLPVELVVERREMMGRAVPLLVGILVALATGLRIHEKVRRDDAADVRLRRRREERRLRPSALLLGRRGDDERVDDAVREVGVHLHVCRDGERKHHGEHRRALQAEPERTDPARPRPRRPDGERQQGHDGSGRGDDVRVQNPAMLVQIADADQVQPERQGEGHPGGGHRDTPEQIAVARHQRGARNRQPHAQHEVQQDVRHVEDRRRLERRDVSRVDQQEDQACANHCLEANHLHH